MSEAKTNARKCAVQALYQWQMSGSSIHSIEQYFLEEQHLNGVPQQLDRIDQALSEFVDRPVEKIDPVERAILRIGAYELINRLDTPYKVIINESVNLAKFFGAEGSHKYINGILDKLSQKQRALEISAKQGQNRVNG